METFYMVLNEATHYTAHRHAFKSQAVAEAKRLARANPGTDFLVLEAVGSAVCEEPVKFTEFEQVIPF